MKPLSAPLITHYEGHVERVRAQKNAPMPLIVPVVEKLLNLKVHHYRRNPKGETNEVYDLTTNKGELILRISRSKWAGFILEQEVIKLYASQGIKVPQILLMEKIELGSELLTFCVENKVAGKPLDELIKEKFYNSHELEKVMGTAGEVLARMHGIKTNRYGSSPALTEGRHEQFSGWLLETTTNKKTLKNASRAAGLKMREIHAGLNTLYGSAMVFAGNRPSLIHADFGPKHIYVTKNGEISGIIDFESCESNLPVVDLANWQQWHQHEAPVAWLEKTYPILIPRDVFEQQKRLINLRSQIRVLQFYWKINYSNGLQKIAVQYRENLKKISTNNAII